MTELGYALSTEEHSPNDLVANAREAETRGFGFALISDHYHPWTERQGNAPFVWSVLGGIAEATDELRVGTGVTCPTIRIHPAIVAQAAATTAVAFDDRFFLGVGTGENLNEHVLGDRWPPTDVRLEMLEEAVDVIRTLWEGGVRSHHGEHYTVENARLFTLPDDPPPIHVAAAGEKAATVAGEVGDGLVSTAPKEELVEQYDGDGPRYGQLTVCWADSEDEARQRAHEWWPNGAIEGELSVAAVRSTRPARRAPAADRSTRSLDPEVVRSGQQSIRLGIDRSRRGPVRDGSTARGGTGRSWRW